MEMTGRDLIVYIMANHLEDAPISSIINSAGLMTVEQAAILFGVGTASIETFMQLGTLQYVIIGGIKLVVRPTSMQPSI